MAPKGGLPRRGRFGGDGGGDLVIVAEDTEAIRG